MLDVTITAPADVQAEEADAWNLAQMWAEFRAELEITGEQAEEVYRNLRPADRLCRVLELEARTVGAAGKAGEAARAAAVRTCAGGGRAARRGAVAEMCTAF